LNKASENINKLVNELEGAKSIFKVIEKKYYERGEYFFKKFGSHINKAKPYFDALEAKHKVFILYSS
jgi:hypothetical protein